MADKVRLSKTVVANALPKDKDFTLWDARLPGFGLRVRPTGGKSFVYCYRSEGGRAGVKRRVTIDATNPEVAYEKARALAAQFHGGADPAGDKAEAKAELVAARLVPTVGTVLDRFITDHAARLSPTTAKEYRRLVETMLKPALGDLDIDQLATKHVAAAYHSWKDRPTTASGAVRVLSSAMSWANENGLRPDGPNPASIRLKETRKRDRLFTGSEVARMLASTDVLEAEGRINPVAALAIRLLFQTGCRAGEVTGLLWSNVDFEAGTLRWPTSKTGNLVKPMTEEARTLLKGATRMVGCPFVCPSEIGGEMPVSTVRKAFKRVLASAGVEAGENASLHLIRHYFASTVYSDPSHTLPIAMAIVGHSDIATASRYAHVTPAQVAEAAQKSAERRAAEVKAAGNNGQVAAISPKNI